MRRAAILGLALVLAGCRGSGGGHTADYCAAIAKVRDGSLIPDDITDRQAVVQARRTLEDLARLAPSDIADDLAELRKAMSAIGDIDFGQPDADARVEQVLNDPAVEDAAGRVGQYTVTACGAPAPADGGDVTPTS